VDVVALADHVELVEVANALRADQRRDGTPGDLERAAVDGLEIRTGPRVANDIEAALAACHGLQQLLATGANRFHEIITRGRRRAEYSWGPGAAVAGHLREAVAPRLDVDHNRRQGARDGGRGEQDLGDQLGRILVAAGGDAADVPQHANRNVEIGRGDE